MGYSLQHYKNLFYRLLPQGDLWPTQDQTSTTWSNYVAAMVYELQRVDALAEDWFNDFIPTGSADPGQLEDWERILGLPDPDCPDVDWSSLTEAQRRSVVLDTLAGAPTTGTDLADKMSEYTGGTVLYSNPELPVYYPGTGLAGQPLAGPAWSSTFLLEYMVSRIGSENDFSGWTHSGSFPTYTANDRRAPDGALTADHIDAGATGGTYGRTISATADGDTVQFSIWIYVDEDVDQDVVLRFTDRSGATTDTAWTAPIGRWKRFSKRFDCGSGGTTPRFDFVHDANEDMWLWGVFCGIVDHLAECVVDRARPSHTYVSYRCIDDNQGYPLT